MKKSLLISLAFLMPSIVGAAYTVSTSSITTDEYITITETSTNNGQKTIIERTVLKSQELINLNNQIALYQAQVNRLNELLLEIQAKIDAINNVGQ